MEKIYTKGMRRKEKKCAAFNKNNMYGHGHTICDVIRWPRKQVADAFGKRLRLRLERCFFFKTVLPDMYRWAWCNDMAWPRLMRRAPGVLVNVGLKRCTIECSRKSSVRFFFVDVLDELNQWLGLIMSEEE